MFIYSNAARKKYSKVKYTLVGIMQNCNSVKNFHLTFKSRRGVATKIEIYKEDELAKIKPTPK